MKLPGYLLLLVAGLVWAGAARAEEAGAGAGEAEAAPEKAAPKIAVITPEQIDGEWYWYAYGGGQQHIVQSAIEKALLRNNVDILDVTALGSWRSLDELIGARTAASKGKELGADYVIAGKATAVKASEGSAYGVNVIRANAEVTLRLIRVSDGKVLAVEDASAQAGGQAVRAAGQEALKQAGNAAARKIAAAVRTATGE